MGRGRVQRLALGRVDVDCRVVDGAGGRLVGVGTGRGTAGGRGGVQRRRMERGACGRGGEMRSRVGVVRGEGQGSLVSSRLVACSCC